MVRSNQQARDAADGEAAEVEPLQLLRVGDGDHCVGKVGDV